MTPVPAAAPIGPYIQVSSARSYPYRLIEPVRWLEEAPLGYTQSTYRQRSERTSMPEGKLCYITPVDEATDPIDPGYGHPGKPPNKPVPPLPPGIWPTPGHPTPPIALPEPPVAMPPIYIPDGGTPDHPIVLPPPGTIWPPLNPGDGLTGKILALVWLVGIGYKWAVLDADSKPPVAQPKK